MQVLVTGGTGFVGSHSALALLEAGHDVRLLVRDRAKAVRVFAALGCPLPHCVVGDVTDPSAVAGALEGCGSVVHAAALVSMEARSARAMMETNVRGTELVVGGAIERKVSSVLYVSSVSALLQPGGAPLSVDTPVRAPATAYGRSKADAERYLRRLQDAGAPVVISYPAAVVGPHDPGLSESNHAIVAMVRDLFVNTSGGFQLIDVRDLAALHARLLERSAGPGRYLAAGPYLSWPELGALFEQVTGQPLHRKISVPGAVLRLLGRGGDMLRHIVSFDFPLTHEAMTFASRWVPVDSTPTIDFTGLTFRPPAETLADTLRWLATAGHLPRNRIGLLAPTVPDRN